MLKAHMTLATTVLVLLVLGCAAFWGYAPRDLLNLAIVLVAPPLMFWLIVRPIKAEKVAQRKAAELEGKP
ncbi:hypothetical protein JIQ88_00525 [Pseudomonas sp. PCH44]|jgi:hypothetical protein|uniref:hypothetical protein n=1 Tax=Pseudomonas sp. PCH44 TaxID=2800904 RepID=UPI001BB03B6D|nr:hypothetical protein [Pseudomonas sp. PCH44]MBS3183568.1 hypothetical protein [Pseudomonas sp. PCH44]